VGIGIVAVLWVAPTLLAALGDRERFLSFDLVDVSAPYVVIGGFVAFDALIPVLPSESVLTTASTLAAQPGNELDLGLVLLAGTAGAVAGDSMLYWISRTLGRRLIQDRLDRALEDPRIAPAWAVFGDSAPLLVIGGRFVPGLRFVVNATMGLRPYPYPRFLALSAIGALLWASFTCVLSFQIGERLSGNPVLSILASVVISGGIVLAMVLVLRRRYLRERGAAEGTSQAA
jgi:membrane protein DedA with SNARE-associated domain